MGVFQKLIQKETKLAVVGLGYVGIPIAVAFSKVVNTIGFDVNEEKVNQYRQGIDPTNEIGDEEIKNSTVEYHTNNVCLKEANFIIVAVPTPINQDKTPDLSPIINATKNIGQYLQKGTIVVYESTVYPGVTEDICIPLLEEITNMKVGKDFKVGYSPERINPGDKIHRLDNIIKIVSGNDQEALKEIADTYSLVIKAGVHLAPSIKVAEAAKVVENSQRDINIAFMNELAIVFKKMGIDSKDVVDAMNTKWNALGFVPGLVGGHCIGVDPYYFVYQAENLGYHSEIVLSGRVVNDSMSHFISQEIIKQLILAKKDVSKARIAILGITFKENCPDIRNSKIIDVIEDLKEYGVTPIVVDAMADPSETKQEYQLELTNLKEVKDIDCLILAVGHDQYRQLPFKELDALFKEDKEQEKVCIDIKSMVDKKQWQKEGYRYWCL